LLLGIDTFLWSRAQQVAAQNEFGAWGFGGVGSGVMVKDKGYGIGPGIGFSLGVNPENGRTVGELYFGNEFMQHALLVLRPLGITLKGGIYSTRRPADAPTQVTRNGSSYYAPLVPGLGFRLLYAETPNGFSAGLAGGIGVPVVSSFLHWLEALGTAAEVTEAVGNGTAAIDVWRTRSIRAPILRVTYEPTEPGKPGSWRFETSLKFPKYIEVPAKLAWKVLGPIAQVTVVPVVKAAEWVTRPLQPLMFRAARNAAPRTLEAVLATARTVAPVTKFIAKGCKVTYEAITGKRPRPKPLAERMAEARAAREAAQTPPASGPPIADNGP
jgi:hypothetical protein